MTKQEAIRKAYGELWNKLDWDVQERIIHNNGWDYETNERFAEQFLEIEMNGKYYRPKSLQGIEDHYSFEKVIGFEYYEVNKLGVVKSLDRVTIRRNNREYKVSEKIMTPQIDTHGYIVFGLRNNTETTKVYLHRILAELFIPNPENKPCVNHKNGVKYDNSLSNLEWCTYQENNIHAFDIGLQKKGKEHHLYGKKGVECHNHKEYNRGWIKIESEDDLPEQGEVVLGYSEEWVDEDFNPYGTRQCHLLGLFPNIKWISAKWWDNQDTWINDEETSPTHYQPIIEPKPPIY